MRFMNVPAIAKKTFDMLKNENLAIEIIQLIVKKLGKLHDPLKRSRFVHRLIDDAVAPTFSSSTVQELSPCKKGCSACCHTQVSVTKDEARLLATRVEGGVEINLLRLLRQAEAKNSMSEYFSIPYEERKCVFLDEEGACQVYEDRPSVCRTNVVLGSADQCETKEEIKPTRLVKTQEADLVIYASFLHSEESGTLSYMLAKALGKLNS